VISNFALCGMPFLAGFYSRDFILEMFSMRYVNIFVFLLFLSTGLTGCYSFRLFYFLLCGDFNLLLSLIFLISQKKRQKRSRTKREENLTGFVLKIFLIYVRQKKKEIRNIKNGDVSPKDYKFSKPKPTKRLPISLTVATLLVPLSLKHKIIKK
jgi:NADH:ubiquinone oxidoreductase subunit 5 (subunit L)/multisubunit Na+/H+ antiporter MnhA subunit